MKKIMFNDRYGLTDAVLEGRKTMTRRIATELNHSLIEYISEWGQDEKCRAMLSVRYSTGLYNDVYPHFQPGETVAVAQCYEDAILDVGEEEWNHIHPWNCVANLCARAGLHNKMFARADLMPHRIQITNVKYERLRDISSEDCLKEGIEARITGCHTFYYIHGEDKPYNFPKQAFAALIDRVSGRGTWRKNSFVFAYEFELVQ